MLRPPVPANEEARLRALHEYQILDTEDDEDFDAIAKVAAAILEVPYAFISLIDRDRQWLKSRCGFDVRETPRNMAFCAHLIAQGSPMLVPDAQLDPRFLDHPAVVAEPHIRFYAGVPLTSPDGFHVGTLCGVDFSPRETTPKQLETLQQLAKHIVTLLELRRKERLLGEDQKTLLAHNRFFELTLELLCTVNPDACFEQLNPAWPRTLGYSFEELRKTPLFDFVHPDDLAKTKIDFERLLSDPTATVEFENRYRHKDGHYVDLLWKGNVSEKSLYFAVRDMSTFRENETQIVKRDAALAENEAQLRALFEGMVEGVVLQDCDGAIVSSNAAAATLLGLTTEQILGRTSIDPRWYCLRADGSLFPGNEHPAIVALTTGQPQNNVVMGVQKPSGEVSWISVNARPLFRPAETDAYATVTTFRDIAGERAASLKAERLERQQRLVTTGTLAAGVGHEINNPLSYIASNIDYCLEELRSNACVLSATSAQEVVQALSDAKSGAERIRKIVQGLRSLAQEDSEPVPTNVRLAIDISINMAMHELRQKATLNLDLGETPLALADESRLTQVLVNLLINAAQAFPTNDPTQNHVTIATRATSKFVEIAVIDNGPGIDAKILPRIFDPFFTTKPPGKGTGLGLAICHNLVSSLGGELTCTSHLEMGATFVVRMPIASQKDKACSLIVASDATNRIKVLVIDDEAEVLRSVSRLLQGEHDVIATSDARDALRRFNGGERFDVILCDIMMPHHTGSELYDLVRQRDPDMASRFVFMSGGVLREDVTQFLSSTPQACIEKPFGSQELRSAVKRIVAVQ